MAFKLAISLKLITLSKLAATNVEIAETTASFLTFSKALDIYLYSGPFYHNYNSWYDEILFK